jgi:hypothetical protein
MSPDLGPFREVVESADLPVPGYLKLLHMGSPDAEHVLRGVQRVMEHPGEADGYIFRFLAEPNWRDHLVAAAAVLVSRRRAPFVDALWAAFDEGSWVSPQLAVTLSLSDPAFAAHARDRIRRRCPVRVPEGLSVLERHVATGPAGSAERPSKNMAALFALLERLGGEAEWLAAERADPEVAALLEGDRDTSGEIVTRWLDAAERRFAAIGIPLRPAAG